MRDAIARIPEGTTWPDRLLCLSLMFTAAIIGWQSVAG